MKRGLTALSLVILAGAGMTADSQLNEIKARYRELDKAIAAMDADALVKFYTPGCVTVGAKGKAIPIKQALVDMTAKFAYAKDVVSKSSIKKFSYKNGTATCTTITKLSMSIPMRGDSTKFVKIDVKSLSTDLWRKSGGVWLVSKTSSLSDEVRQDGKLVK
ncbi:nuclear transport factor 2 family protein [Accumulibacter sp.]|uniref:nuclear transport factor 2 family protein n=1 Tax=Accumulibacter sp. TaxID=2053492 RepID=UPI001ACB74A5|nr:nuclear transport factor 2 family protein [Accumulibacter sp.]MBN8452758.1 nuclear transport factor 2 family protein [Accumulibacter sp.]